MIGGNVIVTPETQRLSNELEYFLDGNSNVSTGNRLTSFSLVKRCIYFNES